MVGAGALGSPVATYLAGAGVGRLGIVDDGDVELSNLHRQHLHFTPDVGVPKAHSAVAKLGYLNPEIVIEPYQAAFNAAMVEGQDLVVDCTDSFEARYAINAACCAAGVLLVEAGVVGTSGLVMAIRPGETACYRCAFPQAPPPGAVPTCAEAGVLGPAAGRDRVAPGARGAEAAGRAPGRADGRVPAGRSRRRASSCGSPFAVATTARTARCVGCRGDAGDRNFAPGGRRSAARCARRLRARPRRQGRVLGRGSRVLAGRARAALPPRRLCAPDRRRAGRAARARLPVALADRDRDPSGGEDRRRPVHRPRDRRRDRRDGRGGGERHRCTRA